MPPIIAERPAARSNLLEAVGLAHHISEAAAASLRAEIAEQEQVERFDQVVADWLAGEDCARQVVAIVTSRIGDGRELERELEAAAGRSAAWRAGFGRALQKALEQEARA